MWVSLYAVVVLGAAGVLVESHRKGKGGKHHVISAWRPPVKPVITTQWRPPVKPVITTQESSAISNPTTRPIYSTITSNRPIPESTSILQSPTTSEPTADTSLYPITSSVRPVDCADHLIAGAKVSGVYEIYPFMCTCGKPVLVWCDMETDGGGWTVFLSRQHQEVQLDFNRTWDDYKAGFGSPYSEYYLGNNVLHHMTHSRDYAIRLDLGLASGGFDFATYKKFKVNSEDNRYSASLKGFLAGGTSIRDCLRYMKGRFFTTLDKDHDSYEGNCASVRGGGWWYYNCRYFNPTSTFNTSLQLTCYGASRPVTQLQLKLRPAICDSSFKTIDLMDTGCGCAAPEH